MSTTNGFKPLALIVEDESYQADIFCTAMEIADFETERADDGFAAMEILNDVTPQIVILDLHLPRASGADVLDHIRSSPKFDNTHVIIATADAQMAYQLEIEAQLVLLKPVSLHQLVGLARRLRPVA